EGVDLEAHGFEDPEQRGGCIQGSQAGNLVLNGLTADEETIGDVVLAGFGEGVDDELYLPLADQVQYGPFAVFRPSDLVHQLTGNAMLSQVSLRAVGGDDAVPDGGEAPGQLQGFRLLFVGD